MICHKYYTTVYRCQRHHYVDSYDDHYVDQPSKTSNDNSGTEIPKILIRMDTHVDQCAN